MLEAKYRLVKELVEAGGLRIGGPFRLRSGVLSRIYVDARSLYSRPIGRRLAATLLASAIEGLGVEIDAILGVATGGIGWAILAAEQLGLPAGYVRPEPKDHGLERLVEGGIEDGSRVVLVDDVVTTGSALLGAIGFTEASGLNVVGVAVLVDRCQGASEKFMEKGIPFARVLTLREIVSIASEMGVDVSPASQEVKSLKC